ncbi:bifunctional glycosyltransferase/CDP-glycerol:glycerophosphate glycerophosphotransferase [Streptomyces griseosporeus]|uniref:bifunctional glycosyltransferase/CDP-glycerol:glycerophosphate glycerophosphotransferase n=1 Tax=Streptomyces griseosporeus TaxID=1910 RepID=UPI0036C2DC84
MPRFSVIVPAYQVQAYLPACLESVLTQSYADLELIVVDDCSPDACGEIAGEYAARDRRVRTLRLPRRAGAGGARAAGAAGATGDYLLFLDGDDTLTAHALRAIADRLKETGEPDVLVHAVAHAHWDGRVERDAAGPVLTERGPAPFRLEDRPGLLRLPAVARNKVCRREFTEREGLTFADGSFADVSWSCSLLMAAESITTLDRVCVHHRRHRPGAAARGPARDPFDVFESYDRIFAFVERRPELARWRPVLFRRMADHFAALAARPEETEPSARPDRTAHAAQPHATQHTARQDATEHDARPDRAAPGARARARARARAEFLRLARPHYRRYRTPGAAVRPAVRLRHALIRFGLHRTHRILRLAHAAGGRLAKAALKAARAGRSALLRLHYRVQLRLPLRADRAVFAAHRDRGHGCNPGALEQAFRAHAPQVRTAWIAAPEHHRTIPPGPRRITPGTAAYWTALARSRYVVSNDHLDLVKRPGQVFVQTRHGTPLKHMGLDLLERPAAARGTDFAAFLRGVDQWDYVLSANRHSTLTWERVCPGRYTTLEYGYPRNDAFQTATAEDVARLRACLGVPDGSVAILYAPTYRDYRRTQHSHLDLERVVRRLGPHFVVLARAHPAQGGPLARTSGRVIDVSGHPGLAELCLASDALVTDYSSIMFDYANLDRPIVLLTDDLDAYEAARGTYFDIRSFPPGAVARSEDELIDIFATGHWQGSRSAQLRSRFRERFCPWDDGRAAERVVRRVVLGERDPVPVVPLDERRPVPSAASAFGRPPLATVPRPAAAPTVTERL